jgi:hypothetical protein
MGHCHAKGDSHFKGAAVFAGILKIGTGRKKKKTQKAIIIPSTDTSQWPDIQ